MISEKISSRGTRSFEAMETKKQPARVAGIFDDDYSTHLREYEILFT